jgi:ABC-type amino acid transport substrate-binding protein
VRIEESPSEAILVRKLAAGRIDAALLNVNESKPLEYVVAQAGVQFAPQRVTRVGELKSYVGFSRRHARAAEARQLFERGMQRITTDGTLARVTRQWADTSTAAIARRRAALPGAK